MTLSAVLDLVGAFLSVEVALTVTDAVVRIQDDDVARGDAGRGARLGTGSEPPARAGTGALGSWA